MVYQEQGAHHSERMAHPLSENRLPDTISNYQYTNFEAEYKIARFLEEDSYDIDITNQTISIKDKEIFKHINTPRSSVDGRTPIYLINYDYVDETRESIIDLKTKFTPVLKDYMLRILTKGSVI